VAIAAVVALELLLFGKWRWRHRDELIGIIRNESLGVWLAVVGDGVGISVFFFAFLLFIVIRDAEVLGDVFLFCLLLCCSLIERGICSLLQGSERLLQNLILMLFLYFFFILRLVAQRSIHSLTIRGVFMLVQYTFIMIFPFEVHVLRLFILLAIARKLFQKLVGLLRVV